MQRSAVHCLKLLTQFQILGLAHVFQSNDTYILLHFSLLEPYCLIQRFLPLFCNLKCFYYSYNAYRLVTQTLICLCTHAPRINETQHLDLFNSEITEPKDSEIKAKRTGNSSCHAPTGFVSTTYVALPLRHSQTRTKS